MKVDFGYDLFVEVEPRYDRWVVPGSLRVGLHVPVRARYFPATALDGVEQPDAGSRTTVFPTLDVMTLAPGFPLELKFGNQFTVAGRRTPASSTWVLVVRAIIR